MNTKLTSFARPQVKCVLPTPEGLYLAAETGLYRLEAQQLQPVANWENKPVQYIAKASSGYWLLLEDESGQTLYLCDSLWHILEEVSGPPGEKIKCLQAVSDGLLAGTKQGIYRLSPATATKNNCWQCLFRDPFGFGEVLWLASDQSHHIRASIKKLGADAKPALLETLDNGISWHVESMSDYQDLILVADSKRCVTRWKGYRFRGTTCGYKKHPLTAAYLAVDGWAVLDGEKLEYQFNGHALGAFKHPILAEAERIFPVNEGEAFLVAGVQGAFLVEPGRGQVTDLFSELAALCPQQPILGKLKRIFALDDGVLLATATYGTFRSVDGGKNWQPVQSDWAVLDAEHLLQSQQGHWWLGCQRALFFSDDNGQSWRYIKFKLSELPHYSELRGGLAIIDTQLFIGTKTGLLVAPLKAPEKITRVATFGECAVEALYPHNQNQSLLVGTQRLNQDQLWHYYPATAQVLPLTQPGDIPILETQIGHHQYDYLIATGEQLFYLKESEGGTTQIEAITPEFNNGDYHLAPTPEGSLIVWNKHRAWLWCGGSTIAKPIKDWPMDVRHICCLDQSIITTDRKQICILPLPNAASSEQPIQPQTNEVLLS